MGGTFDPAHLGHIKISKEAKKKFKLEKVYWAVTNKNPFKSKSKKSLNAINCPSKLNSSAIDEFLIIFLVAAKAKGTSKFKDLGEMNKTESKRLDLAIKFLKLIGISLFT